MLDLAKHAVNIKCPSCSFLNRVTLKQVKANNVSICRGCKKNIRLTDHFYTVRKALRSFSRSIKEFEEELSKLGNITIKI
jgi:phage FluMu protein Com